MSLVDSATFAAARLVVDQVGKMLGEFPKLSGLPPSQPPPEQPLAVAPPPAPPGAPGNGGGGSGTGGSSAEPPEERNPSDALVDLRLTEDLLNLFGPAFRLRGWTLAEAKGRDISGGLRRYTQAAGGGHSCCFLLIPKWILDKVPPPRAHLDAVGAVTFAFAKGGRAFVVSPQLEAPQLVFQNIIGKHWLRMNNLAGRFIPWRHVDDFRNLPSDEERAEALGQLFDLAEVEDEPPATSRAVPVSADDLRELRRILAAVKESWEVLVRYSGVAAFVTDVKLDDPPHVVASLVLLRLLDHGVVAGGGGRHALGLLLDYVRKLGDLPGADAGIINEIITRCRLLP